MKAIDVFKELISRGILEIRDDGTIWKLAIRDNLQREKSISPKRAENRSKRGYLMVKMSMCGKHFLVSAHQAVYTLTKGEIPPGLDVNHKDGKKDNNHPENLELVTRSENHMHAYRTNLRTPPPQIPPRVIERIADQAKDLRGQGLSFSQIAKRLQVSQTTAFRAVRNK
jgi:hypothetical protein